jgi:hypothetical protein
MGGEAMRRATLTEYAIRWTDEAPGYPDTSAPFKSRDEAQAALDASAFEGRLAKRTVTYTEWEEVWQEAGGGCKCWVNPKPFAHYGAIEPGDALEPNYECPMRFPEG